MILHTVAFREEEDAATFGRKAVNGTPKAGVAFGEGDLFVRFEVGLVGELLGRLVDGGTRCKGERTVADGLEEVGFEVEDGLSGAYFLQTSAKACCTISSASSAAPWNWSEKRQRGL